MCPSMLRHAGIKVGWMGIIFGKFFSMFFLEKGPCEKNNFCFKDTPLELHMYFKSNFKHLLRNIFF